MIRTVTAKINGEIIEFTTEDGTNWRVTAVTPDNTGTYEIEITITDATGTQTVYNTLDENLAQSLRLYVSNRNRTDVIQYMPELLKTFIELQAVCDSEDGVFDLFYANLDGIFSASTIKYCSEERLKEWEAALKIKPNGTLEQRRLFLLARLRSQGKFNEAKIQSIVDAFTGGDATVTFIDSTLWVRVLPPETGEVYLFTDVYRALEVLIPAHIALSVSRYYSTWLDVRTNFNSWQSVYELADWGALKSYIAP